MLSRSVIYSVCPLFPASAQQVSQVRLSSARLAKLAQPSRVLSQWRFQRVAHLLICLVLSACVQVSIAMHQPPLAEGATFFPASEWSATLHALQEVPQQPELVANLARLRRQAKKTRDLIRRGVITAPADSARQLAHMLGTAPPSDAVPFPTMNLDTDTELCTRTRSRNCLGLQEVRTRVTDDGFHLASPLQRNDLAGPKLSPNADKRQELHVLLPGSKI
eukprot:6345631-Amphidinium_carterae.2